MINMVQSRLVRVLMVGIFGFLLLAASFLSLVLIKGPNNIFTCRTWYGRPLFTGLSLERSEFGDEGFRTLRASACVVRKEKESGLIKIGFADNSWRLHTYSARFGSAQGKVGLCLQSEGNPQKCQVASLEEAMDELKKGDVVKFHIVHEDKDSIFLTQSDINNDYKEFFSKLRSSIEKKTEFPKSEKNVLVISQIEIKK